MKAAVYYQNGGPEVLRYEEVPDPTCGPDQLVIDVQAVSVEGGAPGGAPERWRV